jgi:hypothetical protein
MESTRTGARTWSEKTYIRGLGCLEMRHEGDIVE